MNEFFTFAVMLGALVLAYVQYVVMLIELQKVLSQELKCMCTKTYHSSVGISSNKKYGCHISIELERNIFE